MRLIIAALLALALVPGIARAQALADHVPADAMVYVGWAGADSPGPGYENSHLRSIIEASKMREFISASLPRLIDHIAAMNPDPDNKIAVPAIEALGAGFWHHPTALYIDGIEITDNGPIPHMGILCDAGADAADMVQRMNDVLKVAGAPPFISCRLAGSVFVFTTHDPAAGAMLDQDAGFKTTFAALDAHPTVAAYVNFTGIWDEVGKQMKANAPADATAQWIKVRDTFGLAGLRHAGMTGAFSGGDWSEQAFVDAPGPRTGLAAWMDSPALDDDLLRRIPATATSASAGSLDIAALFEGVLNGIQQIDADTGNQARAFIGNINQAVGFDIQKDFLGAIGTQWATYTDPTAGGTTILNRPRNPAALDASMTRLEKFLNQTAAGPLSDSGVTVEIRQETIDGTTVHFVATPLVTPAWTIKDGTLYISSYPQLTVASAARPATAPSLLDNPAWQKLRGQLAGPDHVSAMEFMDLPRTVPDGYQSSLMMSRLLLGASDLFGAQAPMMVIPPLEKIMAQTAPGGSIAWSDAAGFHSKSIMPFPGADVIGQVGDVSGVQAYEALVMLGSMGAGMRQMIAVPPPQQQMAPMPPGLFLPGGGGPQGAKTDINNFKVALDAFEIDCGRYPTTAEGLNALIAKPPGLTGWTHRYVDTLPVDPWGHPYIYRSPGANGSDFDVFSPGPDGIPGNADDVH